MANATAGQPVKVAGRLYGDLALPGRSVGVVLFAHGSGSSRYSPRNRYVAGVLQEAGFATLLLDLLTAAEEEIDVTTRQFRFDIGTLCGRLLEATGWLQQEPATRALPLAYFGASTGAGAALAAAAARPALVGAVVSRGGRPDLAGAALRQVQAPTLLIVGSLDPVVVELNRQALASMRCEKRLSIVEGAGHLFEEPGTLEQAAHLARDWFRQHLSANELRQGIH